MRIEELSVRTLKEDNSLKIQDEENLLIRGGFVRKTGGKLYHTELGMMVMENIRNQVGRILLEHGFRNLGIEGSMDLREVRDSLHDYLKSGISSYRDLPLGLAYWGQVRYSRQAKDSLWLRSHEETVVLADLPLEGQGRLRSAIEAVLKMFGLEDTIQGDEVFLFHEGSGKGPDWLYAEREGNQEDKGSTHAVGSVRKVLTKDVRTIKELMTCFDCGADAVLKTILFTYNDERYAVVLPGNHDVDEEKVKAFLDITDSAFQTMDEATIRSVTGAEPGYSGPVGLKGVKILVDQSVRTGTGYYTGANLTDHHLADVSYGRDFTGEKGDFAKVRGGRSGYVLGRMKPMKEAIRFRKEDDSLAAAKPEWGYLNLSRIMLAICRVRLDDIGIDLPKEIAPFEVAVLPLDTRDEDLVMKAEALHGGLAALGFRTLLDARNSRFGVKLKDCDLFSIRKRVLVGRRQDEGFYELKDRSGEVVVVNLEELVEILRS
ncbi:MAG TPA: YbaK/EbsC family protein [Clostridiaceae bacterium]|nr:YbaK/EbsC family protein [Clostridiaceae bacterium]